MIIKNPKRDAYTVVELAVAAAIFSIVFGLLVVSIAKIRECANIAHSRNNFLNTGVAPHNPRLFGHHISN